MTDITILSAHALDEGDVALVAFRTSHEGIEGTVILSMYRRTEPDDRHRGTDGLHFEKDDQSVSGYGLVETMRIDDRDLVLTMTETAIDLSLPGTLVLKRAITALGGRMDVLREIIVRLEKAETPSGTTYAS